MHEIEKAQIQIEKLQKRVEDTYPVRMLTQYGEWHTLMDLLAEKREKAMRKYMLDAHDDQSRAAALGITLFNDLVDSMVNEYDESSTKIKELRARIEQMDSEEGAPWEA